MSPTDHIELLNATHSWPGPYVFKFVTPVQNRELLLGTFSNYILEKEKTSSTGKYVSLTIRKRFKGPEEVMAQYAKSKEIKGNIAL